jgi:hypothetical protein
MRVHARLVLGLFGLALAVPGWVVAAPPGDGDPVITEEVSPQPPPHRHTGLFGWRHCVICQRARAKRESGVNVPPPPSLGPAAGVQGPAAGVHDHVMLAPGATCLECQGQVVMTGPSTVIENHAPGYAVVGGSAAEAPGYAVVGGPAGPGADPAPIGVARNSQAPWTDPRMAAAGPRPGSSPYDPAVRQSSLPPGQVPLSDAQHNSRTSIVAHALGFPKFGQLRRDREDKERQKHAAIAYDESSRSVNEIPASMVYGKTGH